MDNGWRFGSRTEQDVELLTERQIARKSRRPSRRQRRIVLLALAMILVAWILWALLVG